MIRFILLLLFVLPFSNSSAQSLISISPDTGFLGQRIYPVTIVSDSLFTDSIEIWEIRLLTAGASINVYSGGYPGPHIDEPDTLILNGFLDINYNLPTGKYDLIVVRTDVANPGVNLYTETLLDVFTIINPDGFILCKVFGDLNMNKIFDPNEPLIFPKYFIHSSNNSLPFIDSTSGFLFSAMNGNYSASTGALNDYIMTTDSNSIPVTVLNDTANGGSFGIIWALDSMYPTVFSKNNTCMATLVSNGLFVNLITNTGAFYKGNDSIIFDIINIIDSNTAEILFYTNSYSPLGYYDIVIYNIERFSFPHGMYLLPDYSQGNIEGDVFFDLNQNGQWDAGEVPIPGQNIQLLNNGYTAFTNSAGHYKFIVDTGSHILTGNFPGNFIVTNLPDTHYIHLPPDTISINFGLYSDPDSILIRNFYFYPGIFRCNQQSNANWQVVNPRNNFQNGTLTIVQSTNATFQSSTIPPSFQNADTIQWNFQLGPFQTLSSQVAYMSPPLNDTVTLSVVDSVFDQSFNYISCDSFIYNTRVLCAVDPNDKSVSPPGVGIFHRTIMNTELIYTIRFQNTGTDTAYNVIVADPLNNLLDPSKLQIIGSSHTLSFKIDSAGVLNFIFNNILLPDSNIDEPNSHGFVIFKISPDQNLPENTYMENTASIYFDFNPAVVTNTVFNTYVSSLTLGMTETFSKKAYLFPNPASYQTKIFVPTVKGFIRINIFDLTGRLLFSKYSESNPVELELNAIKSGHYLIQISGNNYLTTEKLIIIK